MNCVVRWPGSVHDARIMRECTVFTLFETVPRPLEGFVLGDSGYMRECTVFTLFETVPRPLEGFVLGDSGYIRECTVFTLFETVPRPLEGFILGDSGYTPRDWLLTPFIHVTNPNQQHYNDSHSATRCIIERCNGILKKRWHCLHTGLRYISLTTYYILLASVIYGNMIS